MREGDDFECAPRLPGCGTQHPHRALGGTRVLLAAAPTTPPCFRRWRRSSSLLRIFSGKIILNFGFQESLRTFLKPIFTGGVVTANGISTKNSPGGLPEEHSFFYSKHGCAALTWCAAGLTSGTLPRRGRRCRPECRTPEIRQRPARQPAALRT